jgi:hypothetical protein
MSATDESNEARAMRKARQLAQTEQRKARAAQTLRDNLMRRKAQARARRAGEADMTDGLPAAKTDESQP